MNQQKLISFRIDPCLERMYKAIGYTQYERTTEIQKLESALVTSYQHYMSEVSEVCEDLRAQLLQAQEEYKNIGKIFGENTGQIPVNANQSLRDQIKATKTASSQLKQSFESRIHLFQKAYDEITELFNRLNIPEDERGEFNEIGETDLSLQRLDRFKEKTALLEKEKQQRKNYYNALVRDILEYDECLQEPLSQEVQEVLEQKLLDNGSLSLLRSTVESFDVLKKERVAELEALSDEIDHLYLVLAFEQADKIQKPTKPTEQNLRTLQDEVQFLREQRDTRLPQVIKDLKKEIVQICDVMKVPMRARPRYNGNSIEDEAEFLADQLSNLKQQQITVQPILDVIYEIETAKDLINSTGNVSSREKGATRRLLEEEKARRRAKERLPKLEQKLLSLLVDFKEKNGYDFEFNGIKYIQTISQATTDDGSTLGRHMLLQKINESMNPENDLYAYKTSRFSKSRRERTLMNMKSRSPFG